MLKGKNSKEGAYTRDDAGEVSIAVLTVVEEAGHSLGQHLMVVRDETVLGVIDTFAGEQRAGQEMVENVEKEIVCEAGYCVPLVGGHLHFKELATKIHSLLTRSKEKNNPTMIHQ
jgi:ABC-type thiamine transport system substrate-binding protein